MQMIRISVVRDTRYRSTDGFQIYGDGGTGVMDWDHPVTPRRLLFWDDAVSMPPHLLSGHVMGHHLDSIRHEGHLEGTHLLDEQGMPAGTTVVELGPFVSGRFRHAVVTEDELGNAQKEGAILFETCINSAPAPALDLKAQSYDTTTGILTFSFAPSERLAG